MAEAGAVVHMTTDMGTDAFRAIPRRVVNETRKLKPEKYSVFMRKINIDELFVEFEEMGGFGDIPMRDEGDFLNFGRMDVGNRTQFQPDTYQLAIAATYKMRKFDKTDILRRAARKLAIAAKRTTERIAHAPLNQGFSGTMRLGSDGQPLFSTTHERINGDVVSNRVAVDLTSASLESALVGYSMLTDHDGSPIDVEPKYLVVHLAEVPNALRILNGQQYFNTVSTAATGVTNKFIADYNLIVVGSPYIEDVDSWFLLADKDEHEILLVENERFRDWSFVDVHTDDYVYSVQFSQVAGHVTDIGAYGSTGGA